MSDKVLIKTPEEIAAMRVACRLASQLLDYLEGFIKAGITTAELNRIAHEYQVNVQKVIPATLNYAPPGHTPYPASVCISLNHVVCHGIPGPRVLKNGDILNVDVTVIKDGFHGDSSRMYGVGSPSILAKRLMDVTYIAMWRGIRCVRPGNFLGDIGHAIQTYAEAQGFSVVRDFCGHGIGRGFHEEPTVLHYGKPKTGLPLKAGMIFTIEPMINAGKKDLRMLADGWTVVTADHSLSAQWEHTVLVTDDGYEVLTVSEKTPPPPKASDQ
jgi:methionyl aminopeptidase